MSMNIVVQEYVLIRLSVDLSLMMEMVERHLRILIYSISMRIDVEEHVIRLIHVLVMQYIHTMRMRDLLISEDVGYLDQMVLEISLIVTLRFNITRNSMISQQQVLL